MNAAMRELREETGVTSAEFVAEVGFLIIIYFPLALSVRVVYEMNI